MEEFGVRARYLNNNGLTVLERICAPERGHI
jgi:hypothetical protein